MRALVLAVVLAGCITSHDRDPFGSPDGPIYGQGLRCHNDSDCTGGNVCARTHECLSPDKVFDIHALWTVDGRPPNETSCAALTDLTITFWATGQQIWFPFAPVPCLEGKFTITRMTSAFDRVTLGQGSDPAEAPIDASGIAMLDL